MEGHPGWGELSGEEFSAAVSALANAFGDPTRREIYLHLRDAAGGLTCAEVAEHFTLHPNVARHHLDKLAAGGYAVVDLVRGDTAGRPSKRYAAKDPVGCGISFPPRRDNLLATLLARSLQLLPPDAASQMAEEVGYEYGRVLAAQMEPSEGHRSVRNAVTSVADALTAHGFAAHAESRDGSLMIVSEQCPFGEAAQQFPHVVCSVDRGMIRGMLAGLYGETNPRFAASRPAGDTHCVACV
ncbi:MAG: helix-turn-helix transcriptional regulator [Acidimicrobiia bacterium]